MNTTALSPQLKDTLRSALNHHQQGNLNEAETGYREALRLSPGHPEVLQLYGALLYQRGNLSDAEKLLREAIEADPDLAQAQCNLGNVLNARGKQDEALSAYRCALKLDPGLFQVHTNVGNIHFARGDLRTAAQSYQAALDINPDYIDALFQYGNVHRQQGQHEAALKLFRQSLSVNPEFAPGFAAQGNIFLDLKQPGNAIPLFYHALSLQPELFDAHFGMAEAFFQQRRLDDSIRAYRKALQLDPNSVDALNNLGNVYNEKGAYDQAEACFTKAQALAPNNAEAWNNLGNNLQFLGKHGEALKAFQKAVDIDPGKIEAWNNIGQSLIHLSQPIAALSPLRQAVKLAPNSMVANYNLAYALHLSGERQEAYQRFRKLLREHPDLHLVHDTLLMCLSYDPHLTPEEQFAEHVEWGKIHGEPRRKLVKPLSNTPDPDRKLKIGYVSTDLGKHPVGHMTRSTITGHDKDAFEIYIYSGRALEDEMTEEFRQNATCWRSIIGMSESALAEQIRADGIDILIDLNGHTAGSRLPVFAQKPAPIQVTWIGYCDTTGLDTVDYVLMDPITSPPELDHLFTEEVVRLPETRFCFTPPDYAPAVAQLPALVKGHITFASFNNLQKVNDDVIHVWSEILKRVPNSKLMINWKTLREPLGREVLEKQFESHGISTDRLDLRQGAASSAGVLGEYGEVDIALDTFPYSGGITTCEALWMGVPVVTLTGNRAVARQSASIIAASGTRETIASSQAEYIDIAVNLASDIGQLYSDRKHQRQRIQNSALCNADRFLSQLEPAYRTMWHNWCATHQSGNDI